MNALASTRLSFCRRCPTPCAPFTAGTLDHADPEAACELETWRSRAWSDAQPLRLDAPRGEPMPGGLAARAVAVSVSVPCSKKAAAKWGPPLWRELHAICEAGALTAKWLTAFIARVPCEECRRHARELLAAHPPEYRDASAQIEWAFKYHNAVRKHLGQAPWPAAPPFASKPEPV